MFTDDTFLIAMLTQINTTSVTGTLGDPAFVKGIRRPAGYTNPVLTLQGQLMALQDRNNLATLNVQLTVHVDKGVSGSHDAAVFTDVESAVLDIMYSRTKKVTWVSSPVRCHVQTLLGRTPVLFDSAYPNEAYQTWTFQCLCSET